MKDPIVLLASGTRGDVQPYLALGQGLQAAGFRVRVATHAPFRALVESCGLPYAELDGNPSELMARPGGHSALTYDGSSLRSLQGTLRFYRLARPLYQRLLESAWQACQGAGALLAGLPGLWGVHIAEALGVPCAWGFMQPFSRTRFHPSALLPFTFSLGGTYNRLTQRAVEQITWLPWRATINRWRRRTLRLPPAPLAGLFSNFYDPATLVLYAYSPCLAPPPPDLPSHHRITGYWFLEEKNHTVWRPPPGLECFLQDGAPPVSIGFGSPGMRQPEQTLKIILHALQETGLRAVLTVPAETLPGIDLPPSVMRTGDLPHPWLFARVAAAVHHGGAGSTASSLRAGLPTLILPLAIDQFFWGKRVAALGAGPPPLPQRSLETRKLAQALCQVAGDPGMLARARQLGEQIARERGVERAVELIRSYV